MSNVVEKLFVLIKKKKIITILVNLLLGIVLMSVGINLFRETIREQQIASVGQAVYANKQFVPIQESDIQKLLSNKEQTVIGIIDTTDNKGLDKVDKMFQSTSKIEGLPSKVFIYQPVYKNTKLNKSLQINDKNTFLVIENGKELGRYSFNDLSVGYEEIVKGIDTIINPKIDRKKPIRTNKEESTIETTDKEKTHTSEISFE